VTEKFIRTLDKTNEEESEESAEEGEEEITSCKLRVELRILKVRVRKQLFYKSPLTIRFGNFASRLRNFPTPARQSCS
jgi:hypothetical protein